MSQRTCRVFPTFPRSFLCLNKFWISYLFKETKAKGKGHPSLSSLAPCPERSKTRTNAAELWCSTMPLMCTKQLRSKKSCKLQKCHCLPKSRLMSSPLGQAGVVIFWSSFFVAINLKCFKNKIGKFKEITVSKLTCLNICDISICHTFCLFVTPSFCCKRLPFLPFLRVQETTDRWSSLPGATRMGHLKVHGTGTSGIRFRLDVPVGKIAMTNPLEVQPATIFLGKLV